MNIVLECANCGKALKNHNSDDFITCLTQISGSNRTLFDEGNKGEYNIFINQYWTGEKEESEICIVVGMYSLSVNHERFLKLREAMNIAHEKLNGGLTA